MCQGEPGTGHRARGTVTRGSMMKRLVGAVLLLAIVTAGHCAATTAEVIPYPNPFSYEKSVQGGIRFLGLPENSVVKIYNLQGKLVRELGPIARGSALWDGRNRKGEQVAPGIYYYVVYGNREDAIAAGKLSVIK